MSYFLVATGTVPPIDDIPQLRFVPAQQAQTYVSDILSAAVESRDQEVSYLLDDGTATSDTVITEASDQVAAMGAAFEATRLGQVVVRLLEAGCTVRVWWTPQTGGLPTLDVFDNPAEFLNQLTERLRSGVDLNCMYEARS